MYKMWIEKIFFAIEKKILIIKKYEINEKADSKIDKEGEYLMGALFLIGMCKYVNL